MTKLRLIHDGQLTLNLGGENKRVKNIELQVLLLEDCVMFLQVGNVLKTIHLTLFVLNRNKMRSIC